MKKIQKFIIKVISLILIIFAPFLVLFIVTENIPNLYDKTYLAEFNDKYKLLNETKEKKIIFVGGSSLPFGLRSDLIEEELPDYKVINFGLYASLGTKFMMDMSKSNIKEGDIVILSPEINEQTYSLYFNPTAVLQACDGYSKKYNNLSAGDNLKLFYNYYKYSFEKIKFHRNKYIPNSSGIYSHDSFNEWGDIYVERQNNSMINGYDSTMDIVISNSLLDSKFIKYVNNYCEYVRAKGAKIYFNFSPCNERAIVSSRNTRDLFQETIDLKIRCDRLSNVDDCIMDYRYFYDTNFHLNSSGALYYTSLLVNNLKRKLGFSTIENNIIVPEPPEINDDDVIIVDKNDELTDFNLYNGEGNVDYVDYFTYRKVGSSYQITGIIDEYKNIEKIILPSVYNGLNVTTLCSNALYGCINLKEIYVGSTYKVLEESAFNGCLSLECIYLFELDGNEISPSQYGLLTGTSKSVKIYIPTGANYQTGYTWSNYSSYFVYFSRGEN